MSLIESKHYQTMCIKHHVKDILDVVKCLEILGEKKKGNCALISLKKSCGQMNITFFILFVFGFNETAIFTEEWISTICISGFPASL